jgi:hypothetical protein
MFPELFVALTLTPNTKNTKPILVAPAAELENRVRLSGRLFDKRPTHKRSAPVSMQRNGRGSTSRI